MKKVLLGSKKNFYKANLHCHSNLSDGKLSPEQLKEMYKEKGYSILAITDHDSIRSHADLDDADFLTITAMEISVKQRLVSTSADRHMKVCHLNVYALEQDNEYNVCYSTEYDKYSSEERKQKILAENGMDYKREYSAEGINAIIDAANQNGFLVCYNHPAWSLENYADYSQYNNLWALEIYNNDCVVTGLYEYNQQAFDDFLRLGKKVFPVAADDNHNKKHQDSFGGFVLVNCDALEYGQVMNSLKAGDFYASTGPEIYEITLEGDTVSVQCSKAKFISLSTCGRRAERKSAPQGEYIGEAQFKLADDDVYFRIDVVDECGNRANSRAYFI